MRLLRVALCYDLRVLDSLQGSRLPDLLVFPELVDGGYRKLRAGLGVHRLDDPFIARLKMATRNTSMYLVAGSLALRTGQSQRNCSLVFHRERVVYRYNKFHLFKPTGDDEFFVPGTRTGVFPMCMRNFRTSVGIAICYDLRFPELVRKMAVVGMDILAVPARWSRARDDAWFSLLKARAIENHAFVLGCNARGPEGGYSYIFDPLGKVLYNGRKNGGADHVEVVLDLGLLRSARKMFDTVKEARLLNRGSRV